MDDLSNFECYDNLIISPLREFGWDCDFVSWESRNIDWDQYKSVIIRSTWNYQEKFENFIKVLSEIDTSSAFLYNSIDIVKWNINKQYLNDLEEKKIEIVPSMFYMNFNSKEIYELFSSFNSKKLIIKPCISANADFTYILDQNSFNDIIDTLKVFFKKREFIIQPFIENIKFEGEYSLIFFGNKLSHALLKTPKNGDFRVQEEHGGILKSIINPEIDLIKFGERVIKNLPEPCLYCRVDIVKHNNKFLLMEVELIEPSLYFNMDSKSSSRFAKVFNNWDS
tara:strand:- start:583 stop:1425 length:843 start_codon:yes stop_codon:yes gene_type:complete